jgi:hypothetical protein
VKKNTSKNASRPVICLETGKEYPSATKASLALGANKAAVSHQIYRKQKCRGFTFKYK